MIINFTGQPESGKTTLSNLLRVQLKQLTPDKQVIVLDGDIIREVTSNKDYTLAGRRLNVSSAYSIAKSLTRAGKIDTKFNPIVILAVISPFLDLREDLKQSDDVLEFYLTSSRDSRKAYNVATYEPPVTNFTHLDTDLEASACLTIIMQKIDKALKPLSAI